MAEAVVSTVLEIIVSRWIDEISPGRAEREIRRIKSELQMMKAFLIDTDARNSKDERIIHLTRKIKNLSYRIEDVLETYAITIQSRRRRGIKGILMRLTFINDSVAFSKIQAEIRNIETMMSEVTSSRYNILDSPIAESRAQNYHQSLRQTFAIGVDDDLVGVAEEIKNLVSLMVDEEKQWHAISIFGMGGMGKSALAKKLFNHDAIRRHFQAFAWVYVAKDYQIERIWEDILKQLLTGGESREKVMRVENKGLLREQVQEVLEEKKCLIILDDVWSIEDWESLGIFVHGTASRMLLTTRIRRVAESVSGKEYVHTVRCLEENEAWELFEKRAFFKEDSADVKIHPKMEEIGKKIVEQCRGLPLAIVMLGDFMGTKHTLREWEIMYQNSESYLSRDQRVGGSTTISQVLALSYDNLSVRSKLCFLHLGNFPEEADIEVEKLYLLWMAEGIAVAEQSRSEATMMDIAEDYLMELAEEGMIEVQVEEVPLFRRFKACRLHGLMRELCLLKGKEEEFMKTMDFRRVNNLLENSDAFYSTPATRRLAVYLDKHKDATGVPLGQEMAKHLHCLLLRTALEDQQEMVWPREIFCVEKFRLLKVLDFDGLDFRKTKLPNGIAKLVSLRYLSFKDCYLIELPWYIGNLPYLQILDLRVKADCEMIIPDVLWKIKTLRYLYFPERFRTYNNTKLRLKGLMELETLHGLNAVLCCIEDLLQMENLRCLSVRGECSVEDLGCIISLLDRNHDQKLRSSLDVRNFDCYTEERHSVFRQLLACHRLHVFHLEGHIGQLPSARHISEKLVEIVLSGSELKRDPMAILGKLPELQVLVLTDEAFLADEIVCIEKSFLKLKRLELSNLRCLKNWKLEGGSLPKLSKLRIENCSGLKMLPDGLRSLCSLREVKGVKMPPDFGGR